MIFGYCAWCEKSLPKNHNMVFCNSDCQKFKDVHLKKLQRYRRGIKNKKSKPYRGSRRHLVEILAGEKIDFYRTPEWRSLRYQVLRKYGRRCMCCGSTEGQMQVDHIKPRSKFPHLQLNLSNLQVLCRPCNMGKGAWDQTDWRSK